MPEWVKVGEVGELAEGQMKVVWVKRHEILLINSGGRYYAIGNRCTHQGGLLQYGKLQGDAIECAMHGSKFDIRTGEVVADPAWISETAYRLEAAPNGINIELA